MKVSKRIAFIIPYFGKFNSYFQLFLNSCKYNPEITWIIFTDDKTYYSWPENVYVNYCDFSDIQKLIRQKFDFPIKISRPYKLCDYRPAYGYIFASYLKEFDFWGYCDTDLIWGRITNFITGEILDNYDKIGILGHCTIIRNTNENNLLFMKELNGLVVYRKVFSEERNQSFDEEFKLSINNIFEDNHKAIFQDLKIANIYTKSCDFRLIYMDKDRKYKKERKKRAFFIWDEGELIRYEKINNSLIKNQFLYIHMQSRPMKLYINNSCNRYKIIPNVFDRIENYDITKENFDKIKIKYFNLHYFKLRLTNLKIKLFKFGRR